MEQRLNYQKTSSGAFQAMLGMENYVRQYPALFTSLD